MLAGIYASQMMTTAPSGPSLSDLIAIFGASRGGFYDLTDPNTLFQDAARTTPATVGGAVRGIIDLSGNNRHMVCNGATTATLASDPTTPSGHVTVFPTGMSVGFTAGGSGFGSAAGLTAVSAVRTDAVGMGLATIGCDYSLDGRQVQATSIAGSKLRVLYFSSTDDTHLLETDFGAWTVNQRFMESRVVTPTGARVRRDGVDIASNSIATAFASKNTPLTLGCDFSGSTNAIYSLFFGKFYSAFIIDRALNTDELAIVEGYISSRAGTLGT